MKKITTVIVFLISLYSAHSYSAVCTPQGNINGLISSSGVAGFSMDVPLTGCSCDHSVIWIDTETHGGRLMYSSALTAKTTNKRVLAVIEDGKGQGAPGNSSIVYRYWATCQLKSLEIL